MINVCFFSAAACSKDLKIIDTKLEVEVLTYAAKIVE